MQITPATDSTKPTPTYLIYGEQGVGKTSSIKYLPGKKLVIDIDNSSVVLHGEKNIDIVPFNSHDAWSEWLNIVAELLKTDLTNYNIIVIDNLTELFRSCLAYKGREGKNDRVPEMRHYQQIDFTMIDSFRALKTIGKTLVFTAWETQYPVETATGQTFNKFYPDIRKTIVNNVLGLCDVIGRLVATEEADGQIRRGFYLQPRLDMVAKNRLDSRTGCLQDELIIKE